MLAGGEAARPDIAMARRRCQHDHRLDGLVRQNRVDVGGAGEGELGAIGVEPLLRAAGDMADIEPVRQIHKAARMGQGGRSEPDDGDTDLACHFASVPLIGRRTARSCACRASRQTVNMCRCVAAVSLRLAMSAMRSRK